MGLRETIFVGGSKYGPPIGGLVKKKSIMYWWRWWGVALPFDLLATNKPWVSRDILWAL